MDGQLSLNMLRLSAGSQRLSGSKFQVNRLVTAKHRRPKLFRR